MASDCCFPEYFKLTDRRGENVPREQDHRAELVVGLEGGAKTGGASNRLLNKKNIF